MHFCDLSLIMLILATNALIYNTILASTIEARNRSAGWERCQDSLIHRFRTKELCNRQPSCNIFASDRYHLCILPSPLQSSALGRRELQRYFPRNDSGAIIKSAVISKYLGDIKVDGSSRDYN